MPGPALCKPRGGAGAWLLWSAPAAAAVRRPAAAAHGGGCSTSPARAHNAHACRNDPSLAAAELALHVERAAKATGATLIRLWGNPDASPAALTSHRCQAHGCTRLHAAPGMLHACLCCSPPALSGSYAAGGFMCAPCVAPVQAPLCVLLHAAPRMSQAAAAAAQTLTVLRAALPILRSAAARACCGAGSKDNVATTGTWHIHPNVFNAVPRGASVLFDIRDTDYDRRQRVIDAALDVRLHQARGQGLGEAFFSPTPCTADGWWAGLHILTSNLQAMVCTPCMHSCACTT